MNQEDKKFIEDLYEGMTRLIEQKNDAYGDSYATLRDEEGIAAFRIRLSDKFNRLKTLLGEAKTGKKAGDESVDDTIRDIIGYCTLELLYKNRQAKNKEIVKQVRKRVWKKKVQATTDTTPAAPTPTQTQIPTTEVQ